MTTDRSYRKALPLEAAIAELRRVRRDAVRPARSSTPCCAVVERGDVVVDAPARPSLVA